jgi:hypothetical protein
MAKKDRRVRMEEMLAITAQYDPFVQKLAHERFYAPRRSGHQLYNPHTHQLRNGIRDEAQAIAVLLLVKEMARVANVRNFWFSKDEQKLLRRVEQEPPVIEPTE